MDDKSPHLEIRRLPSCRTTRRYLQRIDQTVKELVCREKPWTNVEALHTITLTFIPSTIIAIACGWPAGVKKIPAASFEARTVAHSPHSRSSNSLNTRGQLFFPARCGLPCTCVARELILSTLIELPERPSFYEIIITVCGLIVVWSDIAGSQVVEQHVSTCL